MKPQWFQILLALADQARHGYAIQRDVSDRTEGAMMLWPAMLYRSLAAMADQGLIGPVDPPDDEPLDERRLYYAITTRGRRQLAEEAERLTQWADLARERIAAGGR